MINNALVTPSRLTETPVSRFPNEMPLPMASMYRLIACPRSDGDAVVCKREFAEVLLMLIEKPAMPNSTGNPQNHGFRATKTRIVP